MTVTSSQFARRRTCTVCERWNTPGDYGRHKEDWRHEVALMERRYLRSIQRPVRFRWDRDSGIVEVIIPRHLSDVRG